MSETNYNLAEVVRGFGNYFVCGADFPRLPCVICAGSFNPIHTAHIQLLKLGETKTRLLGFFELSITNVDKPPLDVIEIKKRMRQFEERQLPLVLTNRPRYLEKIEIFPRGSCFVMGADTFERLVDLRYYDKTESPIDRFESAETRFVVAPRRLGCGNIRLPAEILHNADQSNRWTKLTTCISPDEFQMDISSTNLREAGSKPM